MAAKIDSSQLSRSVPAWVPPDRASAVFQLQVISLTRPKHGFILSEHYIISSHNNDDIYFVNEIIVWFRFVMQQNRVRCKKFCSFYWILNRTFFVTQSVKIHVWTVVLVKLVLCYSYKNIALFVSCSEHTTYTPFGRCVLLFPIL